MKRLLFIVVFVCLFTGQVIAAEIPGFIGGAIGYLSSFSSPAVAFNGKAGQRVALLGAGMQYASTLGFCAIGSFGSKDTLITGYADQIALVTLPADDFYLFLCVKSSGLSGDYAVVALDGPALGMASVDADDDRSATTYPTGEVEAVKAALVQRFDALR